LRVQLATRRALDLQNETHYSSYDSLMLAAALQAGCDVIYTEDLQHNQLVGGRLRIVNPFLTVAHEDTAESGSEPQSV